MRRKVGIGVLGVVLALIFASSASAFNARGSVEQVYATGLTPGAQVSLLDAADQVVETRNANDLGGTLFRNVTPGDGYRVVSGAETSGPLTVLTTQSAPPQPIADQIYSQDVPSDGYGYMETRDGTKLAYSVHPPSDATDAVGFDLPYNPATDTSPGPTLIEYSGYGYANPDGPDSGIATLANLMGFTVVDVNMRGTGCSAGAFDFFEPLQNLDGYDVIETVARQPWVANDQVGMLGISYGGISQLFTAQTQPPSLAAITPVSVIDQVQTTLYPGGVLNTGFAFNWAQERMREAKPNDPDNPNEGQAWARDQIAAGDTVCEANQALHPEAADLEQKIRDNDHYIPEVADPVSPLTFVDKINVPTFMACQWTDEQTGGHCPTLAKKILNGPNPEQKWFTYTNGTHIDSLSPQIYNRLYDFLKIYVAEEPPLTDAPVVQASAPAIYAAAFGINGVTLPPDPIQAQPTLALAQEAFEAQPPVRILFDNGAGNPTGAPGPTPNPGFPYPGFERSYSSWPIPDRTARSWYLGPGGALADGPAADTAADGFTWDADARPLTNFTGNTGTGGLWGATPDYQWSQDPDGSAVAYATAPLTQDASVLGAGAVNVWVRSSEPNVDLQATISEVRPDGKETFVQNGWVRGDMRKLDDDKSTLLEPVLSLREVDDSPLPPDHFVPVTIPLYYEGHMYRTGSQIRVRISAPNGDQPIWSFGETEPAGQAEVAIGYGPEMPSRLILPVAPGASAPTGLPPCPGLRGEPCRDYEPFQNTAVPVGDTPSGGGTTPGGGTGGGGTTSGGQTTSGGTAGTCVARPGKPAGKKGKKRKKSGCGPRKKRRKKR